jgi:hypothetical protein
MKLGEVSVTVKTWIGLYMDGIAPQKNLSRG